MRNEWPGIFGESGRIRSIKHKYAIAFTARSGSTWLGDILTKSHSLGQPKEWLSTDAAKSTILKSGCGDIGQYYRYIQEKFGGSGVFGVEITWPQFQMANMEAQTTNILSDIPVWFFLRRRDFVAQAVSLHKAISTGHFHSTRDSDEKPEVEYDENSLHVLVARIMRQEFYWRNFFKKGNLSPTPLWYEDMVKMRPLDIVGLFHGSIGLAEPDSHRRQASIADSQFSKIASAQSQDYAEIFRRDNSEVVSFWEENRGLVEKSSG